MEKYKNKNVKIPKEKRKEINDKIITIINTDLECDISKSDIFNAYTGDGGLHELKFEDFDSFHDFSEAKKEIEVGQFFTPHDLCKFLVHCIKPTKQDLVGDLTFGMGNFFNYLPEESNVYGTELDIKAYKVAKFLYSDANLANEDIRYYDPKVKLDIIFGNPPFNLKFNIDKEEYLSQLFYCIKAAELLKAGGLLSLIVPNSFLKDDFFDKSMIVEMDKQFNFVCQFDLPTNAFKQVGVDHFETKIMIFQRKSDHIAVRPYQTAKVEMTDFSLKGAEKVYTDYIKPVVEQKEKVKAKVFLENLHRDKGAEEFQYKVKKFLFDIKRNPKINHLHSKAMEKVNVYYTQKKPDDMDMKEWNKKKLTKKKVLGYLTRIVKQQHEKEEEKIQLVKSKYGLKLKGYSHKSKIQISKLKMVTEMSFNDMILNQNYPFTDKTYYSVFKRKLDAYKKQSERIKDMKESESIDLYLNLFKLKDSQTGEVIRLNGRQRFDLSRHIQKKYSIISWEMGSGKTIGGIAWYNYLLAREKVRNVFVVGPALAIKLTWKDRLERYGEKFRMITSLNDIESIQKGEVVIISYNILVKYQRHIKKYVKMQSQKVALLIDESDELTSHRSLRTKFTKSTFRRCRYKLLTTGTVQRNNINEMYSQLEILYNNSINMINECRYKYYYDSKNDNLIEKENNLYMKPFPAYGGQQLFKQCFSPSRTTVFGIRKDDQNIYNKSSLEHLIEKTITTRKFAEIVGEKKYEIKTHTVEQNSEEREVYRKIIQEFHSMTHYFRDTGNSRKQAMLKIIQQLQLLIKSTSIPHHFKEYNSSELPGKYKKIFKMIDTFKGEKIALGTVFKEAAVSYFNHIKKRYPERKVFLILGNVSFKKRKEIIKNFESTKDGILVSTQQSLKSSVNIPSCNRVIIESLTWNVATLSQYFFRCIRFDSKEHTEVHIVNYQDTIELNVLALVLAKERISHWIKTLENKEQSEVYDEFDVDLDILNHIIEKEKDQEGRVQLRWGQQKIV